MNRKGVLIALVLTALLAVAAWWISRPAGPGVAATPGPVLPGLDAGQLTSLTIAWKDGSRARLVPAGIADAWVLTTESDRSRATWPVEAEVVRGAARLLANAMAQPAPGTGASLGGPTVKLAAASGPVRIEIAAEALAGRHAARVTEGNGPVREVLIAESVARLFEPRAVTAWRTARAIPLQVPPSRVTISGVQGACELSRAGGNWGIIHPPLGRADERSVAELLGKLAGLSIGRFVEAGPEMAETGLHDSSPSITIESDRRTAEGERVLRRVLTQTIRVGGPADPSGQSVFLELSGSELDAETGRPALIWGTLVGVADASSLAAMAADPLAYVDRRAMPRPAADVTSLSFAAEGAGTAEPPVTVIERTADGWVWSVGGDRARPIPLEDRRPLEALLRLLCEERADRVARIDAESSAAMRIEITQLSAEPTTVHLGFTEEPGGPGLLRVRIAGLERHYPLADWTTVRNWIEDRVRPPR